MYIYIKEIENDIISFCVISAQVKTIPYKTVGTIVERNYLRFMLAHYDICPWNAHMQLIGPIRPTNFQTHDDIWHRQPILLYMYYIMGSSVCS